MKRDLAYRKGAQAALFFFICIVLGTYWYLDKQTAFFADSLQKAGVVATVLVDGKAYDVEAGSVPAASRSTRRAALKLAYARTLAAREPLLALPSTDPSDLRKAIGELTSIRDELANHQKDSQMRTLVETSLYPVEFLNAAAAAEEARRAFLVTTDAAHEEAYEMALENESRAYQDDIRRFRRGVVRAIPASMPQYVVAGKAVSKAGILKIVETMSIGEESLARNLSSRERCVHGWIWSCSDSGLRLPVLDEPQKIPITPTERSRAEYLRYIHSGYGKAPHVRDAQLIVLSEGSCTSDFPGKPIYVVAYSNYIQGKPLQERGVYVGDIRFIDTESDPHLPFYADLLSRGIRYAMIPPLLHYECTDEVADYTNLFSTKKTLEAASSTASVMYEADARRAANMLVRSGDPRGLDLALSFQDHSADLGEVIIDIVRSEYMNLGLIDRGVSADLDASNLFFSRSGFLTFFMGLNPSFVGTPVTFPHVDIPRDRQPYIYFSESENTEDQSKMLKDTEDYIQIHLAELQRV